MRGDNAQQDQGTTLFDAIGSAIEKITDTLVRVSEMFLAAVALRVAGAQSGNALINAAGWLVLTVACLSATAIVLYPIDLMIDAGRISKPLKNAILMAAAFLLLWMFGYLMAETSSAISSIIAATLQS